MAEPCKLSAVTLALRTLVNNEELTRRLADLAEESNQAYLFSDAIREGVIEGTEGGGKLINDYTLKKESADIKFKAVLFGGVLANTKQGDEALDLLMQEIKNTHGTVAEGLDLVDLISKMDLSGLEEAAKVVFNTTTEEASKIIDDIRTKISNYVGSEYSVVTSGSSIKVNKVIEKLNKEIDDAAEKLYKANTTLGEKTYKDIDKDLKKLQSYPNNNKKYWSTKEGRKVVNKLADKYGKAHNKRILENYLSDIIDAQKIVAEQSERLDIILKEYSDALNGDLKLIENGQNPINYIGADAEWKFIKEFDNSVSQRAKQYGQYALARTLLTDNGEIPQSVYDMLVKTIKTTTKSGIVNYLDEPLTEEWLLDKDRTLEELMTRAYTNTQQLVSDGNLRTIYRQQLIALATDGELIHKDVKYIESLINTMKFSDIGAGFSDILKYNALLQSAKDLGIDVGKRSGQKLWREIVSFVNEDEFDTLLKRGNTVVLRDGLQMTHRELLELVSNMAADLNLRKAIATNQWTDKDLLRVASKYLLGDNIEGAKRLKELIGTAKEKPVTDDIRGVILKAITGKNVPEKTKVAFFDFRKELKAAEDVKLRAEYMDRLSDANKIEIPSATIPEITTTSVDGLIDELSKEEWKGGYLLVNDSQWKMNEVLEQALYEINYGRKAEERIQVMFPKGGLMGQFKSEGGKLIFKTPYSSMFNEFLQTVALKTFGDAGGDSKFTEDLIDRLTRGDLDAIAEVNRTLEKDARKYYGAMLGIDAYDERLVPMLEEMTGISFKSYDAIVDKAAFWKKVDDRFMLEGKILGKYTQEVTTVEDVLKEIESMTPQSIANELSQRFGYAIKADQIVDNGLIRDDIKTAYTNYKLSQTPLELLERKGKLLSVLNGGVADNITTNQFRSMMQSGDFSAYKNIFFHNADVPDEELHKGIKQINDMIFDNLGAQVADNLVDMGYSLPLVNIRDMMYEWAMGTLDVNSGFARAFLAKNNLDPTMSTLNGILNQAIPTELRFAYDEGFKYDNIVRDRLGRQIDQRTDYRGNITILDDGTVLENGERVWGATADWLGLRNAFLEINTPSIVNGKTVKELADTYHIPLFIAQDSWLSNFGKRVLGRTNTTRGRLSGREFVQSMINLRTDIPRGTASHELFHAVFGTLSPAETNYFVETAEKLYKLDPSGNHREANEMLADLFSEYFRTGTFTLPDVGKLQKNASFRAWILQWFQRLSDWLFSIDGYEKEVGKLFDDIIDGKLKTTTKRAGYDVIDEWNKINTPQRKAAMANYAKNPVPPRPAVDYAVVHGAQAKMILTNPGRLDDVIDGKITFDELKEGLGKEFPGLKNFFDSLEESKVDLKNRTYDGLTNDEWRNRYFGHNATSFSREAEPVYTDPATGIKYKLTPDDFVNVRGEWRLKTEFVPIEELDKLKEFDRRVTPKFRDSDDIINDLKEKFKKEGIQSPLYIHYSLADGKAYLAEGNHRLAAAKELGMEYLPVWVDVSKKIPSGKGVKVAKPKPFGPGDFYPDTMAPSDIGIRGTISTPNSNMRFMERGLSPQAEMSAIDAWNTRVKAARESGDYAWAYDYQLIKDYYDNMKNFLSQFEPAELEKLKKYSKVRMNVSDVEGWAKKNGIAAEYLTAFTELIPLQSIHNSKIFTDISFPKYYEAVGDGAKYAYNIDDVVLRGGFTGLPTTDSLTPEGAIDPVWMRRIGQYTDQADLPATDAMKVQMFTKDRTWQQIAEAYGFPTKIVQGDMIEGVKAYGAYGNGIIYFTDMVKEGTPPHELFHAVFNTYVGKEQYDRILSDSSKLFQVSRRDAEELLANSFADWFKTGKFTYGDSLKAITGKNLTKEQKTFLQKVKDFFIDLAETLGLVDRHRAEVEQLFKDIVDVRVGIDTTVPDYIYRLSETTNEFMQDTYSSLVAMSAIRDGVKLPNAGHERQILQEMLNKYYQAFEDATAKGKTLSFKEAQDLKTRMGYALDMFEQNYLAPQYQRFLTPDEKNELFGLKYALGVTTNSYGLDTIREYNSKIMNRYTSATNRVLDRAELITSSLSKTSKSVNEETEKRQKQLIEQGATMKVVNGQPVVVDIRDEIVKQLQNIPSNIIGLEQIKTLGKTGLNQLSNEEVFFLLNVIGLAKNAENKMNLITKTIYKISPQLAKVDFFNTFKAVNGLPQPLRGNLLNGGEALAKYTNTDVFDKKVKEEIFGKIKNKFIEKGQLSYDELSKIIKDSIDIHVDLLANTVKGSELKTFKKEAGIIYQGAFNLYTLLKDVPKAVKEGIDSILKQQQEGIEAALNMLGDKNRLPEIMDAISIVAPDGTVKTFRQVLEGEDFNLSKVVFDTESNVIKSADEAAQQTIDRSWKKSKQTKVQEENRITVEKVNNNYMDGLNAYLNEMEVVSQAERDLINTTWTSAREIAKQYTLTNKLADTDNALASINEAIMRDFKTGVLGFLGNMTQGGQLLKIFGNVGKNITEDVMKKWDLVKDRYRTLYSMSTEQLLRFEPKNVTDGLALNLALYFKEIEGRLGSIDGLTGGTTSRDINRAFAHIGEVVLNINSIHGLFSLMSGVEGNQILKFFRFAEPGDAARVDEFIIGGLGQQYLGGYRNYVDVTDLGLNREWFNQTFASNLTDMEYTKLIQALCGFTITSPKFKWLEKIFNFVNQSNYLFRTLMSYPGQLITMHPQSIAYRLKQTGWERELGVEDLGIIDNIRKQTGILNTTYNEINLFRYASPDDTNPATFYNRYGLPDVDDLMQKEKFYTSDDISSMYAKIDNYGTQAGLEGWFNKFLRNTDAYKDNANNIIDGLFARNFKNIAFLKAIQSNNYMKFATAEQFAEFMASDAPSAMKKKLMDAVAESSGRNFRNILGLGFSGLDRATGGSWERNIWIGLMQMFNFRGAWGQNIARQTWNWLNTSILMAKNGLSKEGRDAMAMYIAKQPERTNFVSQLFNDLRNSWRLVKFQDNGARPAEEDDQSIIDFIQYAYETMQFSSQRRQGIQSYGTTRILGETIQSAVQSAIDPEMYKDTIGIGAFMNAVSKNLGRNWKVPNLIAKTLAQTGGDERMAYLGNEFWKLSFGTLRYLMNEDETSYGYSTELTRGRPGAIPFVISGEISEDGDKAFSYDLANTETWLNVVNWWNARQDGDTGAARTYLMNNLDSFFNASQLFGFVKNVGRALAGSEFIGDKMKGWLADDLHVYKFGSPFDLAEIGDAVNDTEAGHQLMAYGQYKPTDARDVKILIDEVLGQANHRPGNDGFNKSMFNFDKSDHMMNLEESNEDDASMELLLSNIKYERDENFNYITDENGKRIESKYWKTHMADMMMHMNDTDYMTNSNYNFINDWVEINNDDPNYMLYRRLISEGLAGRYATQQINALIDQHNKIHGYKKDKKMNLTKLREGGIYDVIYPELLSQETLITGEKTDFLTAIMQLDKSATMSANIKMVERQLSEKGDNETIKKLFNIDKKGNITLGTKYTAFLEEQARLSQALNEGDIDKFMAETASVTRMFRDEDPYGIMTTTLITSRIRRIDEANNLSAEQKAKAIDALFTDNYDFIQTHIPELINEIGDKEATKAYVAQMNESLYDTSYIGDRLIADNEMANSKSGRKAAVSVSTKAKNLLGKLGSSAGDGNGVGGGKSYNYNFVPVRLDGAKLLKITGSKGYTPVTSSAAIQAYKAHADFSLRKDINRNVKGPTTETISTKKQLSNIESKTTKALEAES